MFYGVLAVILLLVSFLPGWWTQRILARYNSPRADLPFTGMQFANTLRQKFHLTDIEIESAPVSINHYDPTTKTIRLSEDYGDEKSLTAIAIAAHEMGHALQDATHDNGFKRRLRMAIFTQRINQLGSLLLIVTPLLFAITKNPAIAGLSGGIAFGSFILSSLLSLSTLPVEFDASFNRALPILRDCHYLKEDDIQIVKRILNACAMTYVADIIRRLLLLKLLRRR